MLHLILLSLKLDEDKPESLRPFNIVVPAHPHNKIDEWHPNMAAQVPSLNNSLNSKMTLNPNEVLNVLPRYVCM